MASAIGVDVWALRTYGLRLEPDVTRFPLVAFAAHLPVVTAVVWPSATASACSTSSARS